MSLANKKKDDLVEEYEIKSDGVPTTVKIVIKNHNPEYHLILPEVDIATNALLDDIKERLIASTDVGTSDVLDPRLMDILKVQFMKHAETLLTEELPTLDPVVREHFILGLVHELLGLDEIEFFMDDEQLEEVVLNSASEPVRVYHKKHGWLKTNITPESEQKIHNYASQIGRRIGREITNLSPLLDAHLLSKDRANAIISPISTKGHTITIRKFARDPWTAPDFIKSKTVSAEVLSLIWLMIQYEMNMMISGGTGSGKTSFLNICMPFIPPNHRIISIEDTRELQLPEYLYWCPLTTRQPNPEGKGEVSMLNLLINSLRMRPDRIVMGEIRKQREAEVLFEAMHTGHSVYCTIHADTCEQTITRLTNPPIDIPHTMLDTVHLNVVMFRDRRRNIRRVFEVGEFILDRKRMGEGDLHYKPNVVYRWDPRDDVIKSSMMPIRLFEELVRHTGLNKDEIMQELGTKKNILEWMVKHKTRNVSQVGKILNLYYLEKESVLEVVEKNQKPKKLLG